MTNKHNEILTDARPSRLCKNLFLINFEHNGVKSLSKVSVPQKLKYAPGVEFKPINITLPTIRVKLWKQQAHFTASLLLWLISTGGPAVTLAHQGVESFQLM